MPFNRLLIFIIYLRIDPGIDQHEPETSLSHSVDRYDSAAEGTYRTSGECSRC